MSSSSIWPIDTTVSGATILDQSEPRSNGNEGVLCISQSFSITGASASDFLVSYAEHLLGEFYPSAEMQLVYSLAVADRASYIGSCHDNVFNISEKKNGSVNISFMQSNIILDCFPLWSTKVCL